jgi:WD40 repeat protein
VTWQAHRAKVNCLLMMRKEHNYLISGSNDFYIKVWDVRYGYHYFG